MQLLYKLYFDAYKCMSISMCYWIRNQVNVILFLELLTTILYKTRWDTCSTNHHYVHKSRCMCTKWHVWFNVHVLSMRLPPPSPTKQCWYTFASYSFAVHCPWQHWFGGAGNRVFFYYKMSRQFCTRLQNCFVKFLVSITGYCFLGNIYFILCVSHYHQPSFSHSKSL